MHFALHSTSAWEAFTARVQNLEHRALPDAFATNAQAIGRQGFGPMRSARSICEASHFAQLNKSTSTASAYRDAGKVASVGRLERVPDREKAGPTRKANAL